MNDIENPETCGELESAKLDLCLATFLVEAVSSIGTREDWKWNKWLGIGSVDGPDLESLREVLTDTPLQNTLEDHHTKILLKSDLSPSYEEFKAKGIKENRRARLQLMSWALGGSKRTKLQTQAAMLCNLSKAHWYVIREMKDRKNHREKASCKLKWVSVDVIKLWLGQETAKNVFLIDFYTTRARHVQNRNWEKELWNEFLITLSFYGDAGIELTLEKNKRYPELESYLKNFKRVERFNNFLRSSSSRTKVETGPLIPLSVSEMARNLVYAHDILGDEPTRYPDNSGDDEDLQLDGSRKPHNLKYLSYGPFPGRRLEYEIEDKKKKWQSKRTDFERKIKDLAKHPVGTITRGNWGRRLFGGLFIIAVVIAILVIYHFNPIEREHTLERFFDAAQVGTLLTAIVTVLVKVISSDSCVIRNSVFGVKLFLGFEEVLEHCGIHSRREFCHLLASKRRNFRWLSEENLPFVSGSLSGDIRKENGTKLFELSRMGFTVEGTYLFNPYTHEYFKVKKESESEARLKLIDKFKSLGSLKSPTESLEKPLSHFLVIHGEKIKPNYY